MKIGGYPTVSVEQWVGWDKAKRMLLRTINKKPKEGSEFPTRAQKLEWLIGEHSPIKVVTWCIDFEDLRQWVGVHILRHEHVLPYIATQRGDRNPEEVANEVFAIIKEDIVNDPEFNRSEYRDFNPQGSTNAQSFVVNAQTLINISRKRLCFCASKETRWAWVLVQEAIREQDPEMASVMVPNCIYRGWCTEKKSCGYWKTPNYTIALSRYRGLIGRN